MLPYLIIAIELAVIYLVYWLAYVYQPKKSFKVLDNLWGHYDERAKQAAQFRKQESFRTLGSAMTIKPPFLL